MAKVTALKTKVAKTFPDCPTWEQKCRVAWDENKRLEEERLANAKQIHDLNSRLGINDTADRRERVLREESNGLRRSLTDCASERDHARSEVFRLGDEIKVLRQSLETATAALNAEPEYAEDDVDAVEDALTEAVRAVKRVRKEWRAR